MYNISPSSLLSLHSINERHVPERALIKPSCSSSGTVQRPSDNSLSTNSQASMSSVQLCVKNENVPSNRHASDPSLPTTPTPGSASLRMRTLRRSTYHSNLENRLPSTPRAHQVPSPLSDPGPLSDIDLNSLHQSDVPQPVEDRAPHCTNKSSRQCSNTSQETTAGRKFIVATEHPFRHNRPFRKWLGTKSQRRHERISSLTIRDARWDLDNFNDGKLIEPVTSHQKKRHGHQKSSSWAASGLKMAAKEASATLFPSRSRSHKMEKSQRGSNRRSDTTIDATARRHGSAQAIDESAKERAVQRRRILSELLRSEEGYVADLKVLLHVGISRLEHERDS